MDRENKRRKRETHVLETRKHEEREKETTDEQMYEQKGHIEVTHACERDKLKSFLYKREIVVEKLKKVKVKKLSSRRRRSRK